MSKRTPEDIANEYSIISAYKSSGDLELLGQLYKPYMHLVYGVCLKYFKDRELSQDAVIQIFEKLVSAVKDHEIQNFKSWLYVMTKNHCLMEIRKKQYKISQQQQNIESVDMENQRFMHPTHEVDLEENLTLLEACIEELQMEQKECIKLFYLEKKSYKEVVDLTSYDLNKVKSYIQNGKRNLKNCVERKSE